MDEIDQREEIHIHWVRQHKHYVCVETGRSGEDYVDLLKELYHGFRNVYQKYGYVSKLAYTYYEDDLKRFLKVDRINLIHSEATKRILKAAPCDESVLWAFITVNFDDTRIDDCQKHVTKMCNIGYKVSHLKYFKSCYYVIERHRDTGIHHHIHFLIKFHKKEFPSKIIGWIFQTDGVQDFCTAKHFIDYLGPANTKKPYQPYDTYIEYVHGNKCEDKMPMIQKDRIWRDKYKVAHIFEV